MDLSKDRILSSYQHIGNLVYDAARNTSAADAHGYLRWFLLDMPIVPALLSFHSLFAALSIYKLTKGKQFWFKSLVLTMFAAFGGSTLAAVLSGQPAPLFTVSSNYMIGYIAAAWYLVNHITILRVILSFRPITAILAFGAMAAKARSIFSFIDNFVTIFPGAMAGAIALGGLAGSGGSLFVTLEKKVRLGLRTPSELSSPGWGFKSAYLAAAAYYVATDPDNWFKEATIPILYRARRDEARFIISVLLSSHAALETLYGKHFNPLYAIEQVIYFLTGLQHAAYGSDGPESSEITSADSEESRVSDEAKKGSKSAGSGGVRRRSILKQR